MDRRSFLKYMAIGGATVATGSGVAGYCHVQPEKVKSKAHIVIVGAGAGGLTIAAKLADRVEGAKITIIDEKERHCYQPGSTLIACGVYQPKEVTDDNRNYIPKGVHWIKAMVAAYDPDANAVTTNKGETVHYDILVVATGTVLNYSEIEGMDASLIGKHGVHCVYQGPEMALAAWKQARSFLEKGGHAVFTTPKMPIKCAAAPLKVALLTEAAAQRTGRRGKFEFSSFSAEDVLFTAVSQVNEFSLERFKKRDIKTNYRHRLTAVDPGKKVAHFRTSEGNREAVPYDFIHVVPPMSAAKALKESPLSWKAGEFADGGWLSVDPFTLQHNQYPNVFGIGDVLGTPIGKTAASVKKQAPVVADNIVTLIKGKPPARKYGGYTACCFLTDIGKAALIEFGYDRQLNPTFPLIDPMDDGWIGWNVKLYVLKPLYFQMIQGNVPV